MTKIYQDTSLACSRLITERYSTSFTLGIKTLDKRFRKPIFAIYGFVRYTDEIVDTFHEHDKAMLLEEFKAETYRAIERQISVNPVLHSFQWAVNKYGIEQELIDSFLHSMALDLEQKSYDEQGYQNYIKGSAEVVGLMCLRVFCEGDEQKYQSLKEPAIRLGAAFQKVNFLRDMRSDYRDRGRIYFPGVDFAGFDQTSKASIEADVESDFNVALQGIRELPKGSRLGVYLAYTYYRRLFNKIKESEPEIIQTNRLRIPDGVKLGLLFRIYFQEKINLIR